MGELVFASGQPSPRQAALENAPLRNPMQSEITIGDLHLRNNVFLAPMAGITDPAFRVLARDFWQFSLLY